jgi:hypothetical protein
MNDLLRIIWKWKELEQEVVEINSSSSFTTYYWKYKYPKLIVFFIFDKLPLTIY